MSSGTLDRDEDALFKAFDTTNPWIASVREPLLYVKAHRRAEFEYQDEGSHVTITIKFERKNIPTIWGMWFYQGFK